MKKLPFLRSKLRRGRWFHTYRRGDQEISLGVHGLHPDDPRVLAAWAAEHSRWQDSPPDTQAPKANTLAWGLDLYTSGSHHWKTLAKGTQKSRSAIYARYRAAQGDRPLSTITTEVMEVGLYAKGGHGAVNELKALKPVFRHLHKLRIISRDPAAKVEIDKPKPKGFITADADDIERFQTRWIIGTTERLTCDLALYTGAARGDLATLGRHNIKDGLLVYRRHKTNTKAEVPITAELLKVIERTPDISPTFILNTRGKPYTAESLGNLFGDAARAAGMAARLHGLRKAFCVYWAEKGVSTHQIAAMAGHITLAEVERYTRAADRTRLVKLLLEVA